MMIRTARHDLGAAKLRSDFDVGVGDERDNHIINADGIDLGMPYA